MNLLSNHKSQIKISARLISVQRIEIEFLGKITMDNCTKSQTVVPRWRKIANIDTLKSRAWKTKANAEMKKWERKHTL